MDYILIIIITAIATFIGGYFGSLIGGGYLLVMPILYSVGIPIPVALGSRRFSLLGGNISSIIQFHRWKKINYKISLSLIPFTVLGAIIGVFTIDYLNENILKKILGITIIIITVVMILKENKKVNSLKGRFKRYRHIFGPIFATSALILSMLVGGTAAITLTYTLIIFYNQTILQGVGTRKLPLMTANIISTALFIYKGYIDFVLASVLFIAHGLGAWFGSRFYLKQGEEKVKYFFYVIVLILAIKILFFS